MRKSLIILATIGGVAAGYGVANLAAQPIDNTKPRPAPNAGNKGSPVNPNAPVARPPQREQRPFFCFGDAACEREMARQGRPVADGVKQRNENEGPFIQGIPGQTEVPGFADTPVPVVPAN